MSLKPQKLESHDAAAAVVGERSLAVLPKDGLPWWKKPHLLKLNYILLSCILFSSANGYDGSMMNGLQALPLWQDFMNHPKGTWLGFINAIQSVGGIVGIFPSAWTIQHYGRKTGIYLGYLFLITGVILQTTAPNKACFIVARFFLGLASQFYANSASVLITETAYPTHRGICTALYNCGWFVGSLIAAWVTFGASTARISFNNFKQCGSCLIYFQERATIPRAGVGEFLRSCRLQSRRSASLAS